MILLPGITCGAGIVDLPIGRVNCSLPQGLEAGVEVLLGMRPEHVAIASRGEAGACEGAVLERLFLGEAVQYEIEIAGVPLSVRLPATVRARVGDSLVLRFPPDRWQVFPANGATWPAPEALSASV
jgi:ABC-type sugar transport system ATPase subunit